jgi:hypothetical protein
MGRSLSVMVTLGVAVVGMAGDGPKLKPMQYEGQIKLFAGCSTGYL